MSAAAVHTLILGLGNTVLGDDGVGVRAARRAGEIAGEGSPVDTCEAEIGGFALLEVVAGYDRLVVIDAAVGLGDEPGTVVRLDGRAWPAAHHLVGAHGVDLPGVIAFGETLGMPMPKRVDLVLVAAEDVWICSEECTPAVAAAVEPAARLALRIAASQPS